MGGLFMEIRVLKYFLAVVREESISAAAEYLHITQPTLSRQMKELEEELGVRLLNRGKKNRKITLTDEGMLLRQRAEEIVTLADKTEAEFHTVDEIISGDIYIGGGETDAMRLIARAARKLQEDYPLIKYHLFSGNADDVAERLDKGLLDFGIFIEPANMEKYDYLRLPAADTWGVLMRKDSPLARLDHIEIRHLKEVPLITSHQSMISNEFSGWGRHDFDQLNIVATYNLVYNASLLVAEGLGYALCLDKLVNTTGNSELCFKPLEPRLEAHLNLVWKKYHVFSKACEKFLEKVQNEFHIHI